MNASAKKIRHTILPLENTTSRMRTFTFALESSGLFDNFGALVGVFYTFVFVLQTLKYVGENNIHFLHWHLFLIKIHNFHPLEVVGCGSETQLQIDENVTIV